MSISDTTPTIPDMSVIWKIATPDDIEAWRSSGTLAGSGLDLADGFIHSSNGAMVKNVARLFFSDRGDCSLLRLDLTAAGRPVRWTTAEPDGKTPPDDGGILVHYLPDGCSHIFTREPLPFGGVVKEIIPMLIGDSGKHIFPESM